MKLRLPGDLTGGLMIFAIMFTIALVEIYVLKNVRAFRSRRGDEDDLSDTEACLKAEGRWMAVSEDEACCKNPRNREMANDFDLEICEGEEDTDLNTRLGCPDWCFKAQGDRHDLGLEDVPGCEKCPQPRGFGKANRQGGFF